MSAHKLLAALSVGASLLAGCGHKDDGEPNRAESRGEAGGEQKTPVGVTFKPGKGLRVPTDTAQFIGLQIVEVVERNVPSTFHFTAQVYGAGFTDGTNATALASAFVSKADAERLRSGQSVAIEAGDGQAMTGRLAGLDRKLEKANGLVEALVEIADTSRRLGAGVYVNVDVSVGNGKSVVCVPRTALLQTSEGSFVYTVSGERFVRAAVKVGAANDEFAEITDGLYAGDQVAAKPVMTLWLAELQVVRGGKACADD